MVGAPRITRSTSSVPFRPSGTRASSTTTTTRGDTLLSDAEESADNTNLDGNGDETDAESTESEDEAPIGNVDGADEEAKDQADASDPSDLDSDDDSSSSESNSDGSVASILGMDTQRNQNNQRRPPDDRNIKEFRAFCAKGTSKAGPIPFTKPERRGIKLLDLLRKNKTPLSAYDDILCWYFEETGKRVVDEPVGQVPDYVSRATLIQMLANRYNMTDKFPFERKLRLPHCGAEIKVVCFEARHIVWRLLTDPRLTDEDFCFYHDNPLAPPPEIMTTVGQLHTGEAYRNAYTKYVRDPDRQMGIGIQWYIDGAVTGQFDNLSVTALKMSLSCFTLDYRKKDHAWAILGFVVNYSAGKTKGKHMYAASQHDQAEEDVLNYDQYRINLGGGNKKINKAQDFHAQLDTILKSYLPLEANGMLWDLHYRGKLYRNVELVFWTVMVRADTDEAEKHCGKYRSRSGFVKHLCRYCHCPNEETDDHMADYEAKTMTEIREMIRRKDKEGLKAISQHFIDNAWYKLRFDPTRKTSIHGACPSEMLHALLLGIFLYVREGFFDQIGPTSQLAKDIDALAQQYGELIGRNSERNLPGCKFSHGIKQKKKLMAMEYRGVLLLIAVVLRSTKGIELLRDSAHFATPALRKDWILLVETLLQWETFLNKREMDLHVVHRLERKHRYIMYLLKKILKRSQGMGLRIMKFHAILHMADDIKLYGVPQEHDTGANESGHKVTKVAAKLTQKNMRTFEIQTARRLTEFMLIEWGMAELKGRRLWEYYGEHDPLDTKGDNTVVEGDGMDAPIGMVDQQDANGEGEEPVIHTGGTMMEVYWVRDPYGIPEDDTPMIGWKGKTLKMRRHPELAVVMYGPGVVEFLVRLQDLMEMALDMEEDAFELPIYTEHHRDGYTFRGHPDYRGTGVWRDWAMIDWGDPEDGGYGKLPCHIWCFVKLEGLPDNAAPGTGYKYGGIFLQNGTYAVVESGRWDTDETEITMSDLFQPFFKDKRGKKQKFYLADVNAIVAQLCVVPDIGCKGGNRYFQVKNRSDWAQEFEDWVEDPHDDMT